MTDRLKREVVAAYRAHVPIRQIAADYHISEQTVYNWARAAGCPPRMPQTRNRRGSQARDERHAEILRLYNEGIRIRVIADHVGVSISTVGNIVRYAQTRTRKSATWTPGAVDSLRRETIQRLLARGVRAETIARHYKINIATVLFIRDNQTER